MRVIANISRSSSPFQKLKNENSTPHAWCNYYH